MTELSWDTAYQRTSNTPPPTPLLSLSLSLSGLQPDGGATGQQSVTAEKVDSITGTFQSATEALGDNQTDGTETIPNIEQLGRTLFTDYVFAFEVTALLLTIAVVGAVLLARKPKGELAPLPVIPDRSGKADKPDETEELEDA